MAISLLLVSVAAALLVSVDCFPGGPPSAACADITPNQFAHGALTQDLETNPYSVNFGGLGETYTPGQTYTFTVSADDGTTTFRGFFVQARDNMTGDLVGGFSVIDPTLSQLSPCTVSESGVVHNNRNDKTSISFNWTAPATDAGQTVTFMFSVVQVRTTFWANDFGATAAPEDVELVPPPVVRFIGNTPAVGNTSVAISFAVDSLRDDVTVMCQLISRLPGNDFPSVLVNVACEDSFTFTDLPPGIFRVRLVAEDDLGQRGVMRKRIVIPDFAQNERVCSVNLINDGLVVTGNDITVSFQMIGATTGFYCRLDTEERVRCASPYTLTGLASGSHRIKLKPVLPVEPCLGLERRRSLVVRFTIP